MVAYHVENGQKVKKGDLLFETLEGEFEPGAQAGSEIIAEKSGVIASISITPGSALSAEGTVMTLNLEQRHAGAGHGE